MEKEKENPMITKLGVVYRTQSNQIIISKVCTSSHVMMALMNFDSNVDSHWDFGRSKAYPRDTQKWIPERFRLVEKLGTAEESPWLFL